MRKSSPDFQLCQRKMERTYLVQTTEEIQPGGFGLSIEAKNEDIGTPDEMWDKLHTSLIHLMKFTKQRCKNFNKFYSRCMENLNNTLNGEERKEHGLLFAVQMIPSLFREDEEMVIVDNIEMIKSPSPTSVAQKDGHSGVHQRGAHLCDKDHKI
ncbi:uncharacterized protein LOC123500425 [Portunus trituberculatus]|uniref:uncharacterized protein LOC123500425 n=1 Tax=Portunus trituberculatus TaxID=210409 RepID=UPI001E1CE96C|nr:uncharacterized protein LOC123500425 [Portunus trituberculatus]